MPEKCFHFASNVTDVLMSVCTALVSPLAPSIGYQRFPCMSSPIMFVRVVELQQMLSTSGPTDPVNIRTMEIMFTRVI